MHDIKQGIRTALIRTPGRSAYSLARSRGGLCPRYVSQGCLPRPRAGLFFRLSLCLPCGQRKTRDACAIAGSAGCFGGGGGNRTRVQKRSTTSSTYLVLSFDLTATTRTNTLRYGDSLNFRPRRRDTAKAYLTYMTSRGIATLIRQRISERMASP